MRRSASEIIRNLEGRIARLESNKTANHNKNIEISTSWYTGSPDDKVKLQTLNEILDEIHDDILDQREELSEAIEEGLVDRGTDFQVEINIGYGRVQIYCGADDGSDNYQAGCGFCLWSAFVAAGLAEMSYPNASKKLASRLKNFLSIFSPNVRIDKA